MLDQIREDDIVVVWKLDRLARSTRDLLETVETIRGAGGKFQSLSEPWADTTSHAGKMIMTIFAWIAEFERDLIRERTGAGRKAAKKRGVLFGRPPKLIPDQGNWRGAWSRKESQCEKLHRFSTSTRQRSIDWPIQRLEWLTEKNAGSGVFVCWAKAGNAKPIANPARASSKRIFIVSFRGFRTGLSPLWLSFQCLKISCRKLASAGRQTNILWVPGMTV
jgi:hypothetical protein